MTLTEINELSYFDFTLYVKLLYNREEELAKLQNSDN
jgi:hypothetical protein